MELLGGRTPAQFLAQHWQKKPLLVRQAIPKFTGFLTPQDLCRLAGRDDAGARVVRDTGHKDPTRRFRLEQGPFHLDANKIPAERWTVLVQHIEDHHDAGWPLLLRFADVVPLSRIGDLMVSWAKAGGSVGAHVDAYDVFLLQGSGRRRWQIDDGHNRDLYDGDLQTLKNFRPVEEWILEPGDMLYLPPHIGHHGVALDDNCMTWSIGFTAPSHDQLVHNWLAFQEQQHETIVGHYEDPDLTRQDDAGAVADATVARVKSALATVAVTDDAVATFVGRLLTGRPDVEFAAPKKKLSKEAFAQRLAQKGKLALSRKSRLLFRGNKAFINGEEHALPPSSQPALRVLANTRQLTLPVQGADDVLYAFYAAGFVVLL